MSYAHLSQDERYQIQHLRRGGFSAREISAELKRAATTISRELRRNAGGDVAKYLARTAQRQSMARRHAASAQTRIGADQWALVETRLTAEQWSPVQIASETSISHERFYQHIAADRQRGGQLWRHLRCRKRRRRHRCGTVRSKTPDLVRQEFYAWVLAHYAVRWLMFTAATEHQRPPRQLSFVASVQLLRRTQPQSGDFSPSTPALA